MTTHHVIRSVRVYNMNVRQGGKQPILRSTVFNGVERIMAPFDGRPKGLKKVLQERGVDTTGMNADKLREVLSKYEDFKNAKRILQKKVEARGHLCVYFPKFRC